MSETSDARKLALIILPVVTFGLVFYVMYKNERYRDWQPSALSPQQAAELPDNELAVAIAREWIASTNVTGVVTQGMKVTVDSPRRVGDPAPLEATVGGTLRARGTDHLFELSIAVRAGDERVMYCVEGWHVD